MPNNKEMTVISCWACFLGLLMHHVLTVPDQNCPKEMYMYSVHTLTKIILHLSLLHLKCKYSHARKVNEKDF